jgi:hypothetical protein
MRKKAGIRTCLRAILRGLSAGLKAERIDKDTVKIGDLILPKTSFYELLGIFKDEKVVYEANGLYYWIWKKEREELLKDYQEYKNRDEYEVKLKHSKELLNPQLPTELTPRELLGRSNVIVSLTGYEQYVLQHLKTGYPEVYEKYLILQKLEGEVKTIERKMWGQVDDFLETYGFKLVEDISQLTPGGMEIYAHGVRSVIMHCFERAKVVEDGKVKLVGAISINMEKDVTDDAQFLKVHYWYITKNLKLGDKIVEALECVLNSMDIRATYEELENARKELSEAYFNYRHEIQWLGLKILHGEPLKGSCDLCPKVVIGRNAT